MFGMYPAGANWVRHYSATVSARALQRDLVKHADFTAGIFHPPFGDGRGAVLAQRDSCLVLTDSTVSDCPEIVVVPNVELQNLLWSFNSGYANQWSGRELKALTGCDNWADLVKQASRTFAKACEDVEKATAGTLGQTPVPQTPPADPVVSASFHNDDDAPWLPSDYLYDSPMPEVPSCGL